MKEKIRILSYSILFIISAISILQAQMKAPDFTLPDIKGNGERSLSEFNGKVVLMTVWATWCGVCQKQLPEFLDIKRDFQSKGFEIVAVSIDDSLETVMRYIMGFEAKYGKLNYIVLYDRDKKVSKDYLTNGVPNNFIIDREGNIIKVIRNGFNETNIDSLREMLIDAFKKSPEKSNILINNNEYEALLKGKREKTEKFKIEENRFMISGGINKKFLTHTFVMNSDKLYNCYKNGDSAKLNKKTSILIKFTVNEKGKVTESTIEKSSSGDEKTESCIKSLINKFTFPPPSGGISIIMYQFDFE